MRNRFNIITILITGLLLGSCARKSHDLVVACGWDEVFIADISTEVPQKLWSWKGDESQGLPSYMRNKFLTTDDCKPIDKGKKILITSSGGGVALVEQSSGNTLFYASVPNAHSAEILPDNMLVAAASYSIEGNRLNLYNTGNPDVVIASDSLFGAHGLQWDKKRKLLWALGEEELRSYVISAGDKPGFEQISSRKLPENQGHDLVFTDDNNILCLTTASRVWYYNIKTDQFSEHSKIGNEAKVKSVSYNRFNTDIIYVKATDETWWAYYIRFAGSNRVVHLPGEKIYKVRWLYNQAY